MGCNRMRPLLPHQNQALRYCISRDAIALFMEMRLGKTKVVIERMVHGILHHSYLKILVIAPLTALGSWCDELAAEHEPTPNLIIGTRSERLAGLNNLQRWNLINYEGLKVVPEIVEKDWTTVIVDESAKLRNPKTITSQFIARYFRDVQYKFILSGLPAPESPLDYFQQFKFLHGEFLGFNNYWSFRNAACFQAGYDWILKSAWKEKVKQEIHKLSFVMSKKDANLGKKRIFETRYIPQTSKQLKVQDKIEQEFLL